MTAMNMSVFFTEIRNNLFGGHISQGQVDGINAIITECEKEGDFDHEQQAYILATAFHESAHTMAAIEEYGRGAKHSYGVPDPVTGQIYFGRGLVQLTWAYNYKKMGELLGIDLLHHPELALKLDIACKILVMGMIKGLFVPAAGPLSRYLVEGKLHDWIDPRHEINGNDQDKLIAGYAQTIYAAMLKGLAAAPIIPVLVPPPIVLPVRVVPPPQIVPAPVLVPPPIVLPVRVMPPPPPMQTIPILPTPPVPDPNWLVRFAEWIISLSYGNYGK